MAFIVVPQRNHKFEDRGRKEPVFSCGLRHGSDPRHVNVIFSRYSA